LDINLNKNELLKVAHLETTVVHPDYRGNNLQHRLGTIMIDLATQKGLTQLTCTVSPLNYYSLRNNMNNGLKIKALKPKYGGMLRYILHKKLNTDTDYGKKLDTINIFMEDIEEQIRLLKNGYIGFELHEDRTIDYIKFL